MDVKSSNTSTALMWRTTVSNPASTIWSKDSIWCLNSSLNGPKSGTEPGLATIFAAFGTLWSRRTRPVKLRGGSCDGGGVAVNGVCARWLREEGEEGAAEASEKEVWICNLWEIRIHNIPNITFAPLYLNSVWVS